MGGAKPLPFLYAVMARIDFTLHTHAQSGNGRTRKILYEEQSKGRHQLLCGKLCHPLYGAQFHVNAKSRDTRDWISYSEGRHRPLCSNVAMGGFVD
jgi:hypothetical protein